MRPGCPPDGWSRRMAVGRHYSQPVRDVPPAAELRAITQPPSLLERRSGEHWAGRLYMRRISPYVTRLALRLGLSANQVTWLMIAVGLVGAWTFALPGVVAVLGVVGIQLYLLLDCVDGEVARFTKTQSVVGVYLDRWGHYVVEGSMFAALGVRAADGTDQLGYMVLGMAGAFLALLSKAETDLVDSARLQSGFGPMPEAATTMQHGGLAAGRRVADYFPIHRVVHATEASLLAAVAVIVDTVRDDLWATRGLIIVMIAVVAIVVPLHLVSILNSRRLHP